LLLRKGIFRIDTKKEAEIITAEQQRHSQTVENQPLEVVNLSLAAQLASGQVTDRQIVVTHKGRARQDHR
jgi:hypothetical protein